MQDGQDLHYQDQGHHLLYLHIKDLDLQLTDHSIKGQDHLDTDLYPKDQNHHATDLGLQIQGHLRTDVDHHTEEQTHLFISLDLPLTNLVLHTAGQGHHHNNRGHHI